MEIKGKLILGSSSEPWPSPSGTFVVNHDGTGGVNFNVLRSGGVLASDFSSLNYTFTNTGGTQTNFSGIETHVSNNPQTQNGGVPLVSMNLRQMAAFHKPSSTSAALLLRHDSVNSYGPGAMLDIVNNTTSSYATTLRVNGNGTSGNLVYQFRDSSNTDLQRLYCDGRFVHNIGNQSTADFTIEGDTDGSLFVSDASADSIGIGISTPSGKLHVKGDDDLGATNSLKIENDGGTDLLRVANDGDLIVGTGTDGNLRVNPTPFGNNSNVEISATNVVNNHNTLYINNTQSLTGTSTQRGMRIDVNGTNTLNTGLLISSTNGTSNRAIEITGGNIQQTDEEVKNTFGYTVPGHLIGVMSSGLQSTSTQSTIYDALNNNKDGTTYLFRARTFTAAGGVGGTVYGNYNTISTSDATNYGGYFSANGYSSSRAQYGVYGTVTQSTGEDHTGTGYAGYFRNAGASTSTSNIMYGAKVETTLGAANMTANTMTTLDVDASVANGAFVTGDLVGLNVLVNDVTGAGVLGNTYAALINGGNVGIGTTTPSSTLDLIGTFQYVDGNESSGYVLTSDGSGNATWQASSGGGSFTGNTSGDCITDLYVSNIHSCSPLNINPNDEGNVYLGSTSGITLDIDNNRIGIGTTTPARALDIRGTNGPTSTLQIVNYQSIGSGAGIAAGKARGTESSPSQVLEDDTLLQIVGNGYHSGGSFFQGNARMRFDANEDFTATGGSTTIIFDTIGDGSTNLDERMRIDGSSDLGGNEFAYVGIQNTNPQHTLSVGNTGTTGTFRFIDGNQASGYVLTSDANGVGTWQAPSSSGPSKYTTTSGFTASSPITITHGLGTEDISVDLWEISPKKQTDGEVEVVDSNNIKVTMATTASFKVVVIG